MAESNRLISRPAWAAILLLLLEAGLFYAMPKDERTPLSKPLQQFPAVTGNWTLQQEGVVDAETQNLLKADDTLNRVYSDATRGTVANLFVAYFRSQRAGVSPHSPKVCLPGSGWTPSASSTLAIQIPRRSEPISVNRYVVSHGEEKSLVLYWYQSQGRVVANEYAAKGYLMWDSIRHHRSDTALVRVIVPVTGQREDVAEQAAIGFVRAIFDPLGLFLPA